MEFEPILQTLAADFCLFFWPKRPTMKNSSSILMLTDAYLCYNIESFDPTQPQVHF